MKIKNLLKYTMNIYFVRLSLIKKQNNFIIEYTGQLVDAVDKKKTISSDKAKLHKRIFVVPLR